MSGAVRRVGERLGVTAREGWLVGLLVLLGLAVRTAAFLATNGDPLGGDEGEYHASAMLFADGKPFWGLAPSNVPHESVWKAPLYGAWLGTLYAVLGDNPVRAEAVQVVVGCVTIPLTWLFARRLFGQGVALAAAAIVAVYPFGWIWTTELYPEALAVPTVLLTFWAFLDRRPTPKLAAGVGALVGVNMLLRPSSALLLAGAATAFVLAVGLRRGALLTALSLAVALLLVAPWTIRNAVVTDSFVLISIQDAAVHGSFNETSANDKDFPYAWRAATPLALRLVKENPNISEVEMRSRFNEAAFDYIKDHPESLPKAFFWNGLTRFWDVRRWRNVLHEPKFDGRSFRLTQIALVMYWAMLPFAIWGLVRLRRRKELLLPILAVALAASVVFTVNAATRYRAPLEPLIVVLACSVFASRLDSLAARLVGRRAAS